MTAYYNEIDPAAAHVLRHLIAEGVIALGDVDTRSIKEVTPNDVRGYTQCHFFAGGGLWSVAARLAGWPDDAPLWTGSCPCQPFSAAGKGLGTDDPRHLWPDFHRLIRARRPTVVMGEQVAGAAGYGWFDGVRADLEGEGYASRATDFPACSVDAPHQRNRLYWIAVADDEIGQRRTGLRQDHSKRDRDIAPNRNGSCPACGGRGRMGPFFPGGISTICANCTGTCVTLGDAFSSGLEGQPRHGNGSGRAEPRRPVAEADGTELRYVGDNNGQGKLQPQGPVAAIRGRDSHSDNSDGVYADANSGGRAGRPEGAQRYTFERAPSKRPVLRNGTYWDDADWIACHDEKTRRAQSGIRFLVDGLPGRVDLWRIGGNAIVPEAAAEAIAAFMDAYGLPVELGRAAA